MGGLHACEGGVVTALVVETGCVRDFHFKRLCALA